MNMTMRHSQYMRAFVAARRIQRQCDQAEAEWQRWLRRIELARQAGQADLVVVARRQALRSAETAVALHGLLDAQRAEVSVLERAIYYKK